MSTSFNQLNTVFESTTNSYKYYWWLSILRLIKTNGDKKIELDDIVFEMLLLVWYPINYYKISLGKVDQLTKYVKEIKEHFNLQDQIDAVELKTVLKDNRLDPVIKKVINKTLKYVPYRFVRPWYHGTTGLKDQDVNNHIIWLQNNNERNAPYNINKGYLLINRAWMGFITNNYTLIENYTLFELFKYVEKNNPFLNNLSLKLFKPKIRKLAKATKLWKTFINEQGHIHKCVFENKPLNQIKQLSMDHFIPWSYVTHDELWNLHPMERSLNSSKGNKAPNLNHVNDFVNLQFSFLEFQIQNQSLVFDQINLFDGYTENLNNQDILREKYRSKINSQLKNMKLMGFQNFTI